MTRSQERSFRKERTGSGPSETKRLVWTSGFFRKNRRIGWETVRIFTEGPKKKRKDFRVRHADVFLKGIGKVRAVCSEYKKQRGVSRKFIACSDLKASPRQILIGYRLRWKIEIFHKHIKMFLGFGDVAATHFSSVESHVYLVYCAYLLLQSGVVDQTDSKMTIQEKQHRVGKIFENRKIAKTVQELTKIGGAERVKNELKSVLAA